MTSYLKGLVWKLNQELDMLEATFDINFRGVCHYWL